MRVPRLALASKSPRRREIVASLGWDHIIVDADVDERARDGEGPRDLAARLAREKAADGSTRAGGLLTIGADTVVDVDGVAFGKPRDRDEARAMLRALSGRDHFVHTGIALARDGAIEEADVVSTRVTFGELDDVQIDDFVASGMADDKAGAYAAQGIGAALVRSIDGCFYSVVGLPVFRLCEMLRTLEGEGGAA